jgi:hypothetical protein
MGKKGTYSVGLKSNGTLLVRFVSTNSNNIERETQKLREMGLEEGRYFTVRKPQKGNGYVRILRKGLTYVV